MMTPATSQTKTHIPVLDGIRGIAVLLVIVVHFAQSFPWQSDSIITKLALWGQTGVDLFFVLSGFLITGILLDSKNATHFIRNFYVRRILRIFPLYYLTLIGFYIIWPAFHSSVIPWIPFHQNFWYWIDIQDVPIAFAPQWQHGPEHFWSLAVEEHFYFVWPFLVLWLDARKLYRVIAGAIALSIACRLAFSHYDVYFFTLARLDGLAVGSALAVYLRENRAEGVARLSPWAKRIFGFIGIALILQMILPKVPLPVVHVLRGTLIAIVYTSALLLAMQYQNGRIGKVLGGRALGSIGKYSYAMYVFHPFVLTWMKFRGMTYSLPWLLVAMVATYAVGWISWQLLEKPVLKLKRYFEYSAPVAAPKTRAAAA